MKSLWKRWGIQMKNETRGWKNVFLFTLVQTLKSKAYLVSLIMFLVFSLASVPVMSLISGKAGQTNQKNPIKKVYVVNETKLKDMDFSKAMKASTVRHIAFEPTKESYDVILKRIDEKEKTSVVLKITSQESAYHLDFVKSSSNAVSKKNVQALADMVKKYFEHYKVAVLEMTPQQNEMINAWVNTKIVKTDLVGNEVVKKDTSISSNEYWLVYAILFIVLMVNSMSSSQIATAIISDKASKVVEYLLTSVRPLAIIVGKILAVLITVLIQIISIMLCMLISTIFTSKFLTNDVTNLLRGFISAKTLGNINVMNILCSLLVIALGFIFYATLAGLCGATVSRMEEAGEGLKLFTFANLIGAYVGMGAASALMAAGDNAFVTFALLFPLSSPFLVPGAILIGKTNALLLILAVALQVICIVLLFLFVARVYETLILHNGSKIGIKELIQISKRNSGSVLRKASKGGVRNE
jgi:ABC-2 type transport system permease protein